MSAIITYPDTLNRQADSKKITLDKILQSLNHGMGSSVGTINDITNVVNANRQVYTGAAPPAAPGNPNIAAVFYPDGGGSEQQWDIGSQSWK